MFDAFVLLAPIYLLGVTALLGFVGCQTIWGVDEYEPGEEAEAEVVPDPPTNLVAVAGDEMVHLTWDVAAGVTEYHVLRAEVSGNVAADYPYELVVQVSSLPFTDKNLVNGTTYFYRVTAVNSVGESDVSNEASATPDWPFEAFVTSVMPGDTRPGENGFYGMAIEIGAVPLKIQTLGRGSSLGLTSNHEVRIIDAATLEELGHALVDLGAPDDNSFKYGPIEPADVSVQEVILEAGGTYYVVSQEFSGGDELYGAQNTIVQTRPEATVVSAIHSESGLWVPVGGPGQTYGPVNFEY